MDRAEQNNELRRLVKRWIKTEFQFRLGTYGHISAMDCQKELVMIEEQLRHNVTGKKKLENAGLRLGMSIDEIRFPKKKKSLKKKVRKTR